MHPSKIHFFRHNQQFRLVSFQVHVGLQIQHKDSTAHQTHSVVKLQYLEKNKVYWEFNTISFPLASRMPIRLTLQLMLPQLRQRYMQKPMHLLVHIPNCLRWIPFTDQVFLNGLNAISIPVPFWR